MAYSTAVRLVGTWDASKAEMRAAPSVAQLADRLVACLAVQMAAHWAVQKDAVWAVMLAVHLAASWAARLAEQSVAAKAAL